MFVLEVLQGPDRGRRIELPPHEPQLIGRSSEALPISDSTVSRRHAELTPDDGAWWLRDLASANGTFVNGRRIAERTRLSPGDQVRCGDTLMLFAHVAGDVREDRTLQILDADAMDVTVERMSERGPPGARPGLADRARAAEEHLRVLYGLTALTAGALDRAELLGNVLDLVFDEFRPDRGFVVLGDRADGPLELAAVRWRNPPPPIDEGRLPGRRTIIAHALEHGGGVLSVNAMSDARFASGDSVRDYGIRSAICVPVAAGKRILGVIHIDTQVADASFTEAQLHLLEAVGRHAGLALRNIDLVASRLETERLAAAGETVAALSHSIKNILQGLRGGADAIELALSRDDVALAREGWPILARNLDRILQLTMNMLAWSRAPALDLETGDLNALVREAADLLQAACAQKRVALIVDLDELLPELAFDAGGLHQALVNVLTNALEAAPPKRGAITVATAHDEAAGEAIVRIADNGPGISEAVRANLFAAFRSTKGQRGTGLGLAVTRKILEEHDGRVELDSAPDTGTEVRLVLPVRTAGPGPGDTHGA